MSSKIQHMLLHYEVQPPERAWDGIAAAMDEQGGLPLLSEKLYHFEQEPSPALWQKITARWTEEERGHAVVLPFHKRYSRQLKYSGAVAFFVVIATLTSLLISKKTISEISGPTVLKKEVPLIKKQDAPASTNTAEWNRSDRTPGNEVAQSRSRFPVYRQRVLSQASFTSFALLRNFLPKEVGSSRTINFNSSEKYMVYSDANGSAVRLPKKIFDVFACDKENNSCRERLKILQEKIASSALTADFGGILEILDNLQEKQ